MVTGTEQSETPVPPKSHSETESLETPRKRHFGVSPVPTFRGAKVSPGSIA
jgi:hypothetical protein